MAASHLDGQKATRKHKLTDKNIPNAIFKNPEFLQDSQMYQSLLEMERKLDWTMTRKKVEVQDALSRTPTTTRTLRIFLSHSTSGQVWQTGTDQPTTNVETGEGIPAWSFKVEGRLLEPANQRSRDKTPQRKFSTLIKRMIIEIERDPTLYPESNIVEWPRAPGQHNPSLDGFAVRRTGDAPTKLRIIMFLDHFPEQYKLSPDLSHVLGIKEESRLGVVQTLWNYIKLQGLQDKTDRRMIHADEKLRTIFGSETIAFQQIPELVNRHLGGSEPIVLQYRLDPTVPPLQNGRRRGMLK
ncbi:SWI/SNF and RSC complex subunit Ssr3 [Leucoagaricus gongylophorus]